MSYYGALFELQSGPRLAVLLGVDRITTSPGRFSVEAVYRIFPHIPHGALDRKVATRSRRRKEKPGQYIPGPMDHQLVAVQRLVLLLPKEQQDQLPAEEPGLHVCEETLQVPDHHEDLATARPPPPSPTAPASHCAPDPTLDETVPLDPEVIAVNSFVTQALSLQVNLEEQFYCMDCALLQSTTW